MSDMHDGVGILFQPRSTDGDRQCGNSRTIRLIGLLDLQATTDRINACKSVLIEVNSAVLPDLRLTRSLSSVKVKYWSAVLNGTI